MEEIFNPKNARINLYPIIYQDAWDYYKLTLANFWIADELDIVVDQADWKNKLNDDERFFLKRVLAFFAGSDFIVNTNLESDFCDKITIPEIKFFYHAQSFMEDIHSDTYIRLINNYIDDPKEREELFNAVTNLPSVKRKADWAHSSIESGSFVERLISFAMVEGIFFSGSFAAIFWMKKRGLLPGLCSSNSFISRDEAMHRDFACLLYNKYIENKLPEDKLLNMLVEAVEIEKEFIRDSIPVSMIGMNADLMCTYIEYVADHLLWQLINKKYYNVENPFSWMNMIGLSNKTNFFEGRVSEYAKQKAVTSNIENHIAFDAEI